jgi:putative methionine-R-sulfoxide reductase with GAF domain
VQRLAVLRRVEDRRIDPPQTARDGLRAANDAAFEEQAGVRGTDPEVRGRVLRREPGGLCRITRRQVEPAAQLAHTHAGPVFAGAGFQSGVCSVYLLQPDRIHLVLSATVGLQPSSVGKVRLRLNEGLAGLVAEQLRPQVIADAGTHPRFKCFPEAGEERYHSFLGVPMIDRGLLVGVLVVQTIEPRLFSADEVRMVATAAAQLSPIVSDARMEREAQRQAERLRVVHVTMRTVHDIVNNCLNQLQILRLDAEGHVPEESLALFDRAIHSAAAQLKALGEMEEFTEKRMEIGMGLDCP